MKKTVITNTLILLVLILSSCKKGDNDNNPNDGTFLSVHANTKWLWVEDEDRDGVIDGRWYLEFKNDINNPIHDFFTWQNHFDESQWCYEEDYMKEALFYEILMNVENSFTLKITWGKNHIEYSKYIISGNKMRLEINGTEAIGESNESDYSRTFYFEKINTIPDNLKVCE